MQTIPHLRIQVGGHDQQMVFNLLSVEVFIEVKITSVHFKNFPAGRFKDDTCGGEVLVRFVGNDGRLGATHGHITNVSTGAA